MARTAKKKTELTPEEKLAQALIPETDQPYQVPKNWRWTFINSGFVVTSSKRIHKTDWLSEGIPFYRTRELVKLSENGYVDNELFISEELYSACKMNYGVPKVGDLLVSGVGTIISDFEDRVVNDIYNLSPDYHTKDIHVAVFPLESSSVVMLFIDSRDKRYRKFYRQLKKLEPDDQLAAVNYIVHAYTENVFLSKKINEKALRDPRFRDVCQKAGDFLSSNPFASDALPTAVREFSLSNRNSIPNLLNRKYALSP